MKYNTGRATSLVIEPLWSITSPTRIFQLVCFQCIVVTFMTGVLKFLLPFPCAVFFLNISCLLDYGVQWRYSPTGSWPTERPPPVSEVVPTFADRGVSRGQRNGSPRPLISVYRTWIASYFIQVASQLTSRGSRG